LVTRSVPRELSSRVGKGFQRVKRGYIIFLMPLGPGRYGARAEKLLRDDNASLVLIVSIGGPLGPAFDVATADPAEIDKLPTLLRSVAKSIEREARAARR
jgi:hypothetical protein